MPLVTKMAENNCSFLVDGRQSKLNYSLAEKVKIIIYYVNIDQEWFPIYLLIVLSFSFLPRPQHNVDKKLKKMCYLKIHV